MLPLTESSRRVLRSPRPRRRHLQAWRLQHRAPDPQLSRTTLHGRQGLSCKARSDTSAGMQRRTNQNVLVWQTHKASQTTKTAPSERSSSGAARRARRADALAFAARALSEATSRSAREGRLATSRSSLSTRPISWSRT